MASTMPVPLTYVHRPANPPLGLTYNDAVRAFLGESMYLLILDQDTRVPSELFAVAAREVGGANEPAIMAPAIRAGGRLVSPSSFWLGWGHYWSEPRFGSQPSRNTVIINSGSFIHRRVFLDQNTWFDERLRLYGIDTDFFIRVARSNPSFLVLPLVIDHDLSFGSSTVPVKAVKLREMLASNRLIYANSPWPKRLGVTLVGIIVSVVYAIRHRSLEFLK
jgi:GT2 family glycosyltransferase